MKSWLSAAVTVAVLTLCSGAQANPVSGFLSQSHNMIFSNTGWLDLMSVSSNQKSKKSKKSKKPKQPKQPKQPKLPKTPHTVPELNAATAPMAVLLLGGLLAAGLERRRKKA